MGHQGLSQGCTTVTTPPISLSVATEGGGMKRMERHQTADNCYRFSYQPIDNNGDYHFTDQSRLSLSLSLSPLRGTPDDGDDGDDDDDDDC